MSGRGRAQMAASAAKPPAAVRVRWRGGAGWVVRVDNVHLPVAEKKDRGDGDEPTLQNCLHYGLQRAVVQQILDLTRRSHSERAMQPPGSGMQTRLHTPP
jgi:hypothetical protein